MYIWVFIHGCEPGNLILCSHGPWQVGDVGAEGVKLAQDNPTQAAIVGGVVLGPLTYAWYNAR